MKSISSTHVHILGICGSFMGSLALLAKQLGYQVSGSDQNVYPPMSTQLSNSGITLMDGYDPAQLPSNVDLMIVGNAVSRGNPLVEFLLNKGIPYTSGPEWMSRHLLQDKWVLAVSGTHGKTTTTSMLAWILEYADLSPGFLIGGIPKNFQHSATLGNSDFFVIEADEYDTAFFDKRSKFVHYNPRTLIINNLEFDHADIFDNLAAIQTQFHHLVRTVPSEGLIISPENVPSISQVIEKGCWTPIQNHGIVANSDAKSTQPKNTLYAVLLDKFGGNFECYFDQTCVGKVQWRQSGLHQVSNGLSALFAARHVGVPISLGIEALNQFKGVARRMEIIASTENLCVYDDFAHHPTAIETTLLGLRHQVGNESIKVIIEPRSNTMKMGIHQSSLETSLTAADEVVWLNPGTLQWDLEGSFKSPNKHTTFSNVNDIVSHLFSHRSNAREHWLIMSNGGFDNIYQLIQSRLSV